MNELPTAYLNKKQAIQKYQFLTENMLKNLLFKDIGGFRGKVVKKIGRRILLDETALLRFLADSKDQAAIRVKPDESIGTRGND